MWDRAAPAFSFFLSLTKGEHMKKGGLAILVAGPKGKGYEGDDEDEGGGSERMKGAEAVAKEAWDAIKEDDKDTFVKAFKNLCEMMSDDADEEEEE